MSPTSPSTAEPRRWQAGLLAVKHLGIVLAVGGMASLTAMARLGPIPHSVHGWKVIIDLQRAVFFQVFFVGLVMVVLAGLLLWLRRPRELVRQRWFQAKLVLVSIVLPGLHFFARGRVMRFYDAVEAGDLESASNAWGDVGTAYTVGLVGLLALTAYAYAVRLRAEVRNQKSVIGDQRSG